MAFRARKFLGTFENPERICHSQVGHSMTNTQQCVMLASRKYLMTATVIKTNKIPNKCSGLNSSKELLNTSNDILRSMKRSIIVSLFGPKVFLLCIYHESVLPDCGGSGGGSVSTVRKCDLTICFRFLPEPSRPQYTS